MKADVCAPKNVKTHSGVLLMCEPVLLKTLRGLNGVNSCLNALSYIFVTLRVHLGAENWIDTLYGTESTILSHVFLTGDEIVEAYMVFY